MSDYPDPEEEFELMYEDELELLREQNDYENEPTILTPSNARKSLDYGTQKTINTQSDLFSQSTSQVQNGNSKLNNSFTSDFQPLADEQIVEETVESVNNTQCNQTNPKRTIQELFGDIDDLLFEKPKPKKAKGDKLEEQLIAIEQIVELRKKNKESILVSGGERVEIISDTDRNKNNISRRIPQYPFIGITTHNSERIYVRCHSEEYETEEIARIVTKINTLGVVTDHFQNTWKEAQKLINDELGRASQENEEPNTQMLEPVDNEALWVDIYKPRRYLELLSDEETNKILLKWIKLWDKVVFNRRPKIKPVSYGKNDAFQLKFINYLENFLKLGEDGRPLYKVALLCGRPGLGKTTLAHVVAKHAGYNVIEINASDDRSLDSFKTSLENATQMSSVIDTQKRPNCIVFDEIDGAPAPSIEYLVKFVTGKAVGKGKKKKSEDKVKVLKRPIICICNDAYVPSLRTLRQNAFVITFPPTSASRLAERLLEIAKKQNIQTDLMSMLALAEKTNNDIRSCLSFLHFFKVQNKPVTLIDIYHSNVGQKDVQKGLFSVWEDIFTIKRPKTKFIGNDAAKTKQISEYDLTLRGRSAKIASIVQSFGDYDRLAQGVFENYPNIPSKSTLEGYCDALNWFCYNDLIGRVINESQNYTLGTYLVYAFVVWHFRFSVVQCPKLKYPSQSFEAYQQLQNHKSLVSALHQGVKPKIKSKIDFKSLILDILPLLIKIITPSFRPVNLHLLTDKEKNMLDYVVGVMVDYNLNYIQEKNQQGVYDFNLDPNIVPVVSFSQVLNEKRVLPYPTRQLIFRLVELESIKRDSETNNQNGANSKSKDAFKTPGPKDAAKKACEEVSPQYDPKLPNHLQRLKAKKVQKDEVKVVKDFFGRVISPKNNSKGSAETTDGVGQDIWFKYKEGYSNAVRRKVKISQLL